MRPWMMFAAVSCGLFTTPAHGQTVTVGSQHQSGLADINLENTTSLGPRMIQYGQTFTTPDDISTTLSTWSVWASNYYAATYGPPKFVTLPFVLSILEWSGSAPVGPALYTSAAVTPTTDARSGELITFDIGQALDPTKTYLALLTAASASATDPGFWAMSAVQYSCNASCSNPDAYTGGGLVRIESSIDYENWMYRDINDQPIISDYGAAHDMAFQATFDAPVTATPEPASMTLLATGMAGLAGYARRRKKAAC